MKILVIGGSGFIGTRLVTQLLELGHDVVIYDLAPSPIHREGVIIGDVRDASALARAAVGADCIINLAAEHRDDVEPESLYFDVNVRGAENVVAAAAGNGIGRIVFTSSTAVYGFGQPGAGESAPTRPGNAYGRSKVAAEDVYRGWSAQDVSRSLLIVRPTVVFGEGNRGNLHRLIEQIVRGRFMMIGNGANRKSIAYVGNLVDFMCRRLDAGAGVHVYNYADKPDKNMAELVAVIANLCGRRVPRFALPYWFAICAGGLFDAVAATTRRPLAISRVRIRKFCANTEVSNAALDKMGYVPPCSIDEGLAKTIAALDLQRRD